MNEWQLVKNLEELRSLLRGREAYLSLYAGDDAVEVPMTHAGSIIFARGVFRSGYDEHRVIRVIAYLLTAVTPPKPRRSKIVLSALPADIDDAFENDDEAQAM